MRIEKLELHRLRELTKLFDYNDVEQMIAECTQNIRNGIIDIFVLYDNDELIGELHVMYESDDESYAIRGRRAYLFAFRIRGDHQNRGYGTQLLKAVLDLLREQGYRATPHNYRLTALPHACLHLFRHIAQFVLARRQPCVVLIVQSDEKSDCAIARQ